MLLSEQKTNCKGCGKEIKFFSGFENWAVLDHGVIYPHCGDCSKKIKEFVESLKDKE